jgi:hypothetical protein
MVRLAALTLASLLFAPMAVADDSKAWEGAYERSGKTVKTGEWMGIGGAIAVVAGGVTALRGGAQVTNGIGDAFSGGDGEGIGNGMGTVALGAGVGLTGFISYIAGPAVVAGGSVRQAKAIRMVNPEAPRPWFGYATWALFAASVGGSEGGLGSGLLLSTAAYVTGGMQKGKNRMNWDRSTAKRLGETTPSTFTVDLAPYQYEGSKGLALVGTF